jgi:hypothetical protein
MTQWYDKYNPNPPKKVVTMSLITSSEKAILLFVAGELTNNKAGIEAVTGPIVLNVVNGALKVAAAAFAKLPFGMGGLIDAALASYVAQYTDNLATYEGQGIDALALMLTKIANGLPA